MKLDKTPNHGNLDIDSETTVNIQCFFEFRLQIVDHPQEHYGFFTNLCCLLAA